MKSVSVILLAGGKGTRMRSAIPKQFLPLRGKRIVNYSFDLLKTLPHVKEIIVVCDPLYYPYFETIDGVKLCFASPGLRRQDSVYNGFKEVSENAELVLIHDGARPFLNKNFVLEAISQAAIHGAATLATPLKFTVKEASVDGFIKKTLNRSSLFEIQTPQIIKRELLARGFALANQTNLEVTDDVSLVECLQLPVKLVMSSYQNIKITTQEDLAHAEMILDMLHE